MEENVAQLVERIRSHHRFRKQGMKLQQKIDRSMESFIRINCTGWHPDLEEKELEKFNKEVQAIIKRARAGEGPEMIVEMVRSHDAARAPADKLRKEHEIAMEKLAKRLPIYKWVESVRGAGALGFATIIAETGPLDNYANPQKVWKRLGYAPYEGHAGSTWKRTSWRPRALSSEEWIAAPFSGSRYGQMFQIASWLVTAQWIGAAKSGTGEGQPNGPYGEIYAARRKHTAATHPDWTKRHSHMDGLRVTMKMFLLDLWRVWNGKEPRMALGGDTEQKAA